MTNVVELSKSENSETRAMKEVQGYFIPLEYAASWIAFGQFDRKASDRPYRLLDVMAEQPLEMIEERDQNDGRYWMAFEQLQNAIGRGKITAYGRWYKEDAAGPAEPAPSDVLDDGRTRLVKPEEARRLFTFLGSENDDIAIGDKIYDLVAVNWHELIEVFGPLCLEYGSPFLNENRPQQLSSSQIEKERFISSNRGRPQKFRWEQLNQEIAILAVVKGLPQTQAELEKWAAEKCQELFGEEPATSSIRSKIAPIYERLRQEGR